MQELTQIDSAAAHTCDQPRTERWRVYEPVAMRWSWLNVYQCCGMVFEEQEQEVDEEVDVQKAA